MRMKWKNILAVIAIPVAIAAGMKRRLHIPNMKRLVVI